MRASEAPATRDAEARDPRSATARRTARRRLKVAMVAPRYLPDLGGVEHHVHEVSRRLADDQIEVTILTAGAERGYAPDEIWDGVRVRRTREIGPRGRHLGLAPGLLGLLSSEHFDLMHLQSYHTLVAPLAMMHAVALRRPFVVTFHGGGHTSALRNRARPTQMAILRPFLRRADALIAVARFEAMTYGPMLGVDPAEFVYIPNGADLPTPRTNGRRRDPHLIVSIGRLERYKGHHRVIAALPHVLRSVPDARLWVVGHGPYERELRALAAQLGVADRVEIRSIPPAERQRYADEVAHGHVAVHMSEFETHPISAIEAASLGLSVIAADAHGLSELVQDGLARGVGTDIAPNDLATAIVSELTAPVRLSPPPAAPTWNDCAAQLAELYRSVAGVAACAS